MVTSWNTETQMVFFTASWELQPNIEHHCCQGKSTIQQASFSTSQNPAIFLKLELVPNVIAGKLTKSIYYFVWLWCQKKTPGHTVDSETFLGTVRMYTVAKYHFVQLSAPVSHTVFHVGKIVISNNLVCCSDRNCRKLEVTMLSLCGALPVSQEIHMNDRHSLGH